jgi:hypothetical protein
MLPRDPTIVARYDIRQDRIISKNRRSIKIGLCATENPPTFRAFFATRFSSKKYKQVFEYRINIIIFG